MARKYGKTNVLSEKFEDYSYLIHGVAGVGKTTMIYEIGRLITGSNEGTFVITCGEEPIPDHIPDLFGDVAPTFRVFMDIVKEMTKNKAEYPDTKFIGIDSLDELFRIAEDYVIDEWNDSCTELKDKAKSISQAYKGFQNGENRVVELVVTQLGKLKSAGYQLLEVGHSKIKSQTDIYTGVSYDQITCSLDNKYYNSVKNKVNLVATCYIEKIFEDVHQEKNAFTKKMMDKGEISSERRVIVFRDDDMTIDTKSHFAEIDNKIEFGADNFIIAIENAIGKQGEVMKKRFAESKYRKHLDSSNDESKSEVVEEKEMTKTRKPIVEKVEEKKESKIVDTSDDDDTNIFNDVDTEEDKTALYEKARALIKKADKERKTAVKKILEENGSGLFNADYEINVYKKIIKILS